MGKRESYEPGTFSWVELSTTDPDAAKAFYGDLFDWQAEDLPVPDGGTYSMMNLGGEPVAAIQQKPPQQDAIPPYWFNYITVASADDSAAAAKVAGANVHVEPFDVMDSGRMAVVMDPTGATFGIWEPRRHIGARVVNDPGCLTSNELSTNDVPRATDFYGQLFGWRIEPIDTGGGPPYWAIVHDGAAEGRNGGMRELSPEQVKAGVSPHWMPYFTAASTEHALETAKGAGATVGFGPMQIPTGATFAVLADPQGAYFATFEGEVDD